MAESIRPSRSTRWVRDESVLCREAPCALTVVLGSRSEVPRALHGTGAALWAALEQPATTWELATRLAEGFETDVESVLGDIDPLLVQLAAAGALRPEP